MAVNPILPEQPKNNFFRGAAKVMDDKRHTVKIFQDNSGMLRKPVLRGGNQRHPIGMYIGRPQLLKCRCVL